MNIVSILSKELSLSPVHVQNVVDLLDDGKTVPFIARYRKELTGSMDDQTLRVLAEKLERLRSMEKRRAEILRLIDEQGALTDELRHRIEAAATMTELEDLYLPYKVKRRTRASIAAERGLSPLADALMEGLPRGVSLSNFAARFLSEEKGVASIEDALSGARDVIAERLSTDPALRSMLRQWLTNTAVLQTTLIGEDEGVYAMYRDFSERVSTIPDHRVLAINRGEREEKLRVKLTAEADSAARRMRVTLKTHHTDADEQLDLACADAWSRLLLPSLEREIRAALTERASQSAIALFGENLHHLLMQPPVKGHVTLGVDPGFRTGCKLAVVDAHGKVLQTGVAYFTLPNLERKMAEARSIVGDMIRRNGVTAIAIGNGTASRESESFIAALLKEPGLENVRYAIVSEAGASVYSASKLGAEEFPEYDVSLRSAVSIARRLQDPLAELVKIEPRSIGVGQYQHDMKPAELDRKLTGVVEDCVNAVGVELSTASAALLTYVAGVGPALAKNIVAYRNENGIHSRAELKKVPKLGPKAFEQAAGFLRLADSKEFLDATAVHPESYAAAKKLVARLGCAPNQLRGGASKELRMRAEEIGLKALADELQIGEPTLKDILGELIQPSRDPRDDLPPTVLRSDVLSMSDLKPGMKLTGTVRNVIDFGAFVDIGVHQDGLVHISRLADRFVRRPSEVVKIGDVVDVWVLDVDEKKKRISLTMVDPQK